MRVAALSTWVLAAAVGIYLLRTWLVHGGLRRADLHRTDEARPYRFTPPLIFGHGGLAASGLAVWIAYLIAGGRPLAWTAFAIIVAVATLGATMFGMWLRYRPGLRRGRHAYVQRHAAEDHFPPPAVLAHGTFAAATLVMVGLTALRVAT